MSGGARIDDRLREADTDNPLGYFEFKPVKQIHRDAAWLKGAAGEGIKIVAPLLPHLPAGLPCHVIFVELDEVLASQSKMITRRGETVTFVAASVSVLLQTRPELFANFR